MLNLGATTEYTVERSKFELNHFSQQVVCIYFSLRHGAGTFDSVKFYSNVER